MAFDKPTRNRLAKFVSDARDLIAEEFTQQFQTLYGISDRGAITPIEKLSHLDDIGLSTAAMLRERIDYLVKTHPDDRDSLRAAVTRLAREQAFTVLNRLAALRMAEKRGLIVESVGKGYQSKGFKVFEQVAGSGLGDTYHRYRRYLFCLFDELAVDLGVVFDRGSPQGLLFPREPALQKLFESLNAPDLEPLWTEDETIGWIYQYYNDPAERKTMREESTAPRNSRELAVRNQFFTPRYVVEFLTDNTLGRIWYEMTGGKTRLKEQCRYLVRRPTEIFLMPDETAPEAPTNEGLSQEELLKQPIHIPHRPLKDPREIRLLDPACGSMHFGLYAFDLYEVIYEEAWDLGQESLHSDYPEKDDLLRYVPRLIIEHNIHGIDIDPRAVQIAGLSLWLRAQKSWQAHRVAAGLRPRILRSQIVCAEPMPGSPQLLKEFTAPLYPPVLGQLVEKVFGQMELAGVAGSLLKIEEEIAGLVREAKKLWQERPRAEQMALSLGLELTQKQGEQEELPLDLSGISNERFWETAEERIYAALRAYAEQAESGGYQRRLFAEDAARGFAFIDVFRKRYDVALMNPPFGAFVAAAKNYVAARFEDSWRDMFSSFIERAVQLLGTRGLCGAITSSTFLNLSTFEEFRHFLLRKVEPRVFVNLGPGIMDDAAVSAACSILENAAPEPLCPIWFIEARNANDIGAALSLLGADGNARVHAVTAATLGLLPQSIFAYWLSDRLRSVFVDSDCLDDFAHCQFGLHCRGNDDQLFRAWWEIEPEVELHKNWPVVKLGGDPEHFFRDSHYVLDWRNNGAALNEIAQGASGGTLNGAKYYFQAGLTYIYTAQTTFSLQPLERGSVFSAAAHGCFPKREKDFLVYLSFLNSDPVRLLLKVINPNRFFQSNYVRLLPVPDLTEQRHVLEKSAISALHACRDHAQGDECSRLFFCEWTCRARDSDGNPFEAYRTRALETMKTLAGAKSDADDAATKAYGFRASDLILLQEHIGASTARTIPGDQDVCSESHRPLAESHVAYVVGCALGRWDVQYATGKKAAPELPDPFALLPRCPPGMLQNRDELPAELEDVPAGYPLRISWPGILVDDENHSEDIVTRTREALEVIWKRRADAIEHEVCDLLSVKTLREYFRRPSGFFADHLKRYSKSRRQAPIYWPLSTAKGSYTLWLYYHRLTDQALHTALADFVDPKLKAVLTEINNLREGTGHRARLEELLDLEKELADFRTEIERIIKLPWKPNLNDGVLITASPLWKLFLLPKWRKNLNACWEKLEQGDYDWAHLANTMWPKRVEAACKKDRSIAIAHDLAHLCQVEPPKPKGRRTKKKNADDEDFDQ